MKLKLLLIEDNEAQQLLWKVPFEKEGDFDVVVAKDGIDGLLKLSINPDVILLDMSMPRMNGIEFIKEIQENDNYRRYRKIPIAMLTVWIDRKDVKEICNKYTHVQLISKEEKTKDVIKKVQKSVEKNS